MSKLISVVEKKLSKLENGDIAINLMTDLTNEMDRVAKPINYVVNRDNIFEKVLKAIDVINVCKLECRYILPTLSAIFLFYINKSVKSSVASKYLTKDEMARVAFAIIEFNSHTNKHDKHNMISKIVKTVNMPNAKNNENVFVARRLIMYRTEDYTNNKVYFKYYKDKFNILQELSVNTHLKLSDASVPLEYIEAATTLEDTSFSIRPYSEKDDSHIVKPKIMPIRFATPSIMLEIDDEYKESALTTLRDLNSYAESVNKVDQVFDTELMLHVKENVNHPIIKVIKERDNYNKDTDKDD